MRVIVRSCALLMAVMVGVLLSERPTVWALGDSAQIAKGEKVYEDKKCAACHVIKGKGGKVGPDLSTVGAKREAQWLKTFMKDPKATNPKGKMPPFKGTDEELEALLVYLNALR